jgi:hypothetical protein
MDEAMAKAVSRAVETIASFSNTPPRLAIQSLHSRVNNLFKPVLYIVCWKMGLGAVRRRLEGGDTERFPGWELAGCGVRGLWSGWRAGAPVRTVVCQPPVPLGDQYA